MLAAVVLNIVSFIDVMSPALDNVGEATTGTLGIVAIGHVSLGGSALLLSFRVVGSWLISPLLPQHLKIRCYGVLNKKIMRVTLIFWISSLILGFLLYVMLKTGFLGSFPLPSGGS